jgi:transcriptional regulator of aroF, aroG, tyrA and aromatic amino acid transport
MGECRASFNRFEIITRDRIGIALEVLEKIYKANIDLNSVEVFPKRVCVKMQQIDENRKEMLKNDISRINDVIRINEIELLNYEKKEKKLLDVINSIVVSSSEEGAFKDIIGSSPSIEKVKKIAATVSKSNSTILITGESGTGKELFARAIQGLSSRKDKSFVTINCAAMPENLIESELFGYEKGSFTGAMTSGKDGLFKEANGGTLFFDEIGELSMHLQAKLLRVLQEGVIRRIGSNKEEKVDVRIIVATNRNLEEMVREKKFREDLYYRLNVIPIYIPPLRERLEDIPLLVTYFIEKLDRKLNKNISTASMDFIGKLMNYEWPGNVRELQNVIERAMNLCEDKILTQDYLFFDFNREYKLESSKLIIRNDLKLKDLVELCEKEAIVRVMEKSKSIRKSAKVLGISHTALINKIKKYNIIV